MSEANKSLKITNIHSIKSIYILKIIIENIQNIKLLNIIRYNKCIQNKLNLDINVYKNAYSKIKFEIEVFPLNPKKLKDDVDLIDDKIEEKNEEIFDFIRMKNQFKSSYHIYLDD